MQRWFFGVCLAVSATLPALSPLLLATTGSLLFQTPAVAQTFSVPLFWCAVEGSPAAENPGYVGEIDTDRVLWRRHERASEDILIPQAGVTLRSGLIRIAELKKEIKIPPTLIEN